MRPRALFAASALLLAPLAAAAQTAPGLGIGAEISDYRYTESGVALTGPFIGLAADYTWVLRPVFLRAEGTGDLGLVDYSSSNSGSDGGIHDYKADIRFLVGHDFVQAGGVVLTPFAGLGYRILYDAENGTVTNTGFAGYDRLSQYFYLPIGLTVGFPLGGGWTAKPTIELDALLVGWQTSYLRGFGFDNDITNQQNSGYGARAAFMVEAPLGNGRLSFGPFLRYWRIGQSDFRPLYHNGTLVAYGYEPSNSTVEGGLAARYGF